MSSQHPRMTLKYITSKTYNLNLIDTMTDTKLKKGTMYSSRSNRGEKLGKLRLWLRVHADDDHHGNETVVGDHLDLLHGPRAPLLHKLSRRRLLLRGLGTLARLAFSLHSNPRRHWNTHSFLSLSLFLCPNPNKIGKSQLFLVVKVGSFLY